MFESTIDSVSFPAHPLSVSVTLPYPEHPIPVSNEELSRRTVLIPGAIVQPGITPPVVPDCCERSFFLRSYINRLRSPAKRDSTSSLGSAKADDATDAIIVPSPFVGLPDLFQLYPLTDPVATRRVSVGDLHRDLRSSRPISEWSYISGRLAPCFRECS